jgi:hypothetical protein
MKELLEELKKIDPDFYDEIARGLEQVDIEYEEDIVQGCVQRAIAAGGWTYQVSRTFQGTSYGKIITQNEDGTKWFHPGDSPAKAILSAYLSAIRIQPCQS